MRKHFILLALLWALATSAANAQIAGMSTLSVLDMSSSARTAGLGMDYLPMFDNDINIGLDNPSMISPLYNGKGAINYVGLFTGSNFGSVAYARDFNQAGTFLFGLRFFSYGRFHGYDEMEQETGDFSAGDYALSVGWGHRVTNHCYVGANFKPVLSQYESYKALALAFDLSASYTNDDHRFNATIMGRNFGAQLKTFDGRREKLPFELSAALSYKLKNAPFRFYFEAAELQRWNLRYEDPMNPTSTTDAFTGETTNESKAAGFFDNLARHALVGVELDIAKVFFARLGFSYRQTKEMQTSQSGFNTSGFSFGFGINIKHFQLAYSRNNYHYGQAPNYISLSMDIDQLFKRR